MRRLVYLFLLLPLLFQLGCERNPDQGSITVSLKPQFTTQEGVTVNALPSTFVCYAIFVHFESDDDGSHCRTSLGGLTETQVTSAFGPFQEEDPATFSISADDTGSVGFPLNVTVHLVATDNQANCDAAESQNDLREMIGTDLLTAEENSFSIESGSNSLNYTVTAIPGDSITNCQDVNGVSN